MLCLRNVRRFSFRRKRCIRRWVMKEVLVPAMRTMGKEKYIMERSVGGVAVIYTGHCAVFVLGP